MNIDKILQQAITTHQEGKLKEAENLYRSILKINPKHFDVNNNLGELLCSIGKFVEAETFYKNVIELKPDYLDAHNNLGAILLKLNRLEEAEKIYRIIITIKPEHAEAHNNLGVILKKLNRLEEAEIRFNKAIELKPDYIEARYNLDAVLLQKELLNTIKFKKDEKKYSVVSLDPNPFIFKRKVEPELISKLYKLNSTKLDDVDNVYLRYGNGKSSDYKLFKNDSPIIKTVAADLITVMKQAVYSDIFVVESFFNIFETGSGIAPHTHIIQFDNNNELINQKFSLVYYLDVGDQNCSEPGILKLEDPDEEILPSEGMIMIFPASRKHSAAYGGKKDRIMIGVNFYSIG